MCMIEVPAITFIITPLNSHPFTSLCFVLFFFPMIENLKEQLHCDTGDISLLLNKVSLQKDCLPYKSLYVFLLNNFF